MNRFLISVIFFANIHMVLIAQIYYPIDTSNVVWNELKESSLGDTYPPYKFIETYLISGDTIIDNQRFFKIFIQESNDSTYVGCFREEDKKIYYSGVDYFGFETDSIVLLYDFNKQKSDTLFTGTWHRIVIENIDSILIGNSYRKRFQMDDGQYWIEGIGSTFGFLFPMTGIPTMYWKSELICYKHNDSLLYLNPNYFDCYTEKQNSIIDTNKIWYTHIYLYDSWSVDTEVIGIGNDTMVNDTTYYNMLRATGGVEIPYQDYGLIRQDRNRVYYKTSAEKPEKLIYDFNISEGDTIIAYSLTDWLKNKYDECKYVCDSIRIREYFQILRRVFYLTALPAQVPEFWIEGLGSSSGILHNFDGRVGGDAFYLSCVMSGDSFLYRKYPSEPCIRIAVGVDKITPNDPLFYPNPVSKNKILHIKNIARGSIIELYDVMGTLVYRRNIESSDNSIKVDLETGIYLYHIIERKEGRVRTGRLIFE
jgi:hypothetical protein